MVLAFPDVLRVLRQSLLGEILPGLATDYAREQATGLLLLVEHLLSRWDRAFDALRAENDDLRATLAAIADAEAGGRRGAGARRPRRRDAASGAPGGEELTAENRELRARLATVIARAPNGSRALRLAEDFMLRQLERDHVAVAVGAIRWD